MKKNVIWLCLVPCVLSFVVTIVSLTLLLLPIFRYANLIGDFRFKKVDGGYAIVEYVGDSKNISLPSSFRGQNVVEISDRVFSDSEKYYGVESVVLPVGLKRIGNNCFSGMKNIENVVIPDACISIGDSAFFGCEKLKTVHFGERILNVGASAFSWTALQSDFLDSNEQILVVDGVALFAKSASDDFVLQKNIRVLAHDACSSLARSGIESFAVEDGSNLVAISERGFAGSEIQRVDLSLAKKLRYVGQKCFNGCAFLEKIEFADSVGFVGDKAFFGCDSLSFVSFGKSAIDFSYQIFDNFSCVDYLEISADCSNFDVALGSEKYFVDDDICLCVSAGQMKKSFVDIFAPVAARLEVCETAFVDWNDLCKFLNLKEAVLPAKVLNCCTDELFVCTDVVRAFGTGLDVSLDCSPNIDTKKLELLGIGLIAKDAFSGQDLGYIDEIEVLDDELAFVGANAFSNTNWFARNDDECVCLSGFCLRLLDRNDDDVVEVGEGVHTLCSGALLTGSTDLRVVLPSTLVEVCENAFKMHVGTIAFRSLEHGNVAIERVGKNAFYFGFDNIVVQTKVADVWQDSENSLVLGSIEYVGKNAFDKTSQYFESQSGDLIIFGSTILVDVRASFDGVVFQVPSGVRVVAANCFGQAAGKPVKLVFGDDIVMIGENNFGNKVREASFGTNLELVEGSGLFEFDSKYAGKLFIISEKCVKLDLVVKTTNKASVLLTTTNEMVDFYSGFSESYELKIIGE